MKRNVGEEVDLADLIRRERDEWKARAEKLEAECEALRDSTKFGRALVESTARAEKAEAERDAALEYADPRRELTKASNDLAAAQAEIAELKDKLTGRDEYNHELKLAKNAAQARERKLYHLLSSALDARLPDGSMTPSWTDAKNAALSAPQDETALREFGRKCIEAAGLHDEPGAVVDAVLKGAK